MSRRGYGNYDRGLPPPPEWLGKAIVGLGATVLVVGVLVLVLRLADSGDDPSELATVTTSSTSTTSSTTSTSTTSTTLATTTTVTTIPATTTTTRRGTTTTRPVTTTRPPTTTTANPGPANFSATGVENYPTSEGTFAGDAQVTNNGTTARGGNFTIKLYRFGELVGTLRGSASAIGPGQTVSVHFTSSDAYVSGVDDYSFSSTPA